MSIEPDDPLYSSGDRGRLDEFQRLLGKRCADGIKVNLPTRPNARIVPLAAVCSRQGEASRQISPIITIAHSDLV